MTDAPDTGSGAGVVVSLAETDALARGLAGLRVAAPGDYEIVRELARGGMGRVLEARDHRHGRTVALKVLLRSDPASTAFPARGRGHRAPGAPTHRAALRAGPLPRRRAVLRHEARRRPLARRRHPRRRHDPRAAGAAAARHRGRRRAGLRARPRRPAPRPEADQRPGRAVRRDRGHRLGLAKVVGGPDPEGPGPEPEDAALTVAGRAFGTPAYMPPEQARGGTATARSDVYALGALAYHLLSGRPPIAGVSGAEAVRRVLAGPPEPLGGHAPDLPADLVAVVEKAMARDPADRYPSAAELAADLARFAAGQRVEAHRYGAGELLRLWLPGAGARSPWSSPGSRPWSSPPRPGSTPPSPSATARPARARRRSRRAPPP